MNKVQMLGKNVAVKSLQKGESVKSNLWDTPADNNNTGEVVHISEEAARITGLKVGDTVFFGTKRQNISIDGLELKIMECENIVAKK